MQRLFFAFPAGLPGAGLLLLRIAVTLLSLHEGQVVLASATAPFYLLVVLRFVSLSAVVSVLIGLTAPIGCLVLALEAAVAFLLSFRAFPQLTAPALLQLNLAIMSVVSATVGPGAFSLDARLFGRREIVFPD